MITRFYKTALCALAALVVGMVVTVVVQVVNSPGVWSHPDWLWSIAQAGAFFYLATPLGVLVLATLSGRTPSTALCIFVAVGWLSIIFAWWAYKPLAYYGEFPWWGVKRHFAGMLPVALSSGLTFAVCARKWLGTLD